MNAITNYNFDGAPVRMVVIDDLPFFVGKDVADRLGYIDPTNAIKLRCKGVAKYHPLSTAGGVQDVRLLCRADVLRLIMGSKLPAAERFERWVFEEVLPSIHKTGGYGAPETKEQTVARGLVAAHEMLQDKDKQIALLAPKAEALDRIASKEGSVTITEAAKVLRVPPRALAAFLRKARWIYRGARGYLGFQDKVNQGLVEQKLTRLVREKGEDLVVSQARITPKGMARLAVIAPTALEKINVK